MERPRRKLMQRTWKILIVLALTIGMLAGTGCQTAPPPQYVFGDWPAGASPNEVGKRVAENFAARKLDFETNPRRDFVIYPEVCGWYGSLTVAQLTRDIDLRDRLIRKFDAVLASSTN